MEAPIAAPYEALLKIIFLLDFIRARTLIVRTLEAPHGDSKSCQQQHWDTISLGVALSYLLIIPSRVTLSIASRGYAFSGLCKSFGEPKAGTEKRCRFWKQKQRASCLARCFISSEGCVPIRLRYRPSETSTRARPLDWGRSHSSQSAAASRCCPAARLCLRARK